jgi:aryl-alcohol dehydrogenase-like predicted oxidoreductase
MHDEMSFRLGDREPLRIGIGGARWSITDPVDDGPAEATLTMAIEAGVGYIDTARAYSTRDLEGHNERLIARVLDRLDAWDDVIVGTKGGHYRDGDSYPVDAAPASLRRDCEASLTALGRERIDLYYLHFPDPHVGREESVGMLRELRDEGLIRWIGLCNFTAEQLEQAARIVDITAVQNRFSPYRAPDRAILNYCERAGIAFLGYSPLGGSRRPVPLSELSEAATSFAERADESVESILMAWLLSAGRQVGLITGARRAVSLASSLHAASLRLDERLLAAISADLERHWASRA